MTYYTTVDIRVCISDGSVAVKIIASPVTG